MITSSFFGDKDIGLSERMLIREFSGYLSSVEGREILSFTSDGIYRLPYKTRWTQTYKCGMIAKMYGVEEYLRKSLRGGVVTLLTLTGYQGGGLSREVKGSVVSREDLFDEMKRGWRLLSNLLVKVSPGLEYVWVMEPHKSGYPHMHVAIFGYVSKELQERLSRLWSEKYEVGSREHGIDFSVKSVKESIQSVRNYLMKYITKGIGGEGKRKWTVEEWVYHALAWKHHHRYIGMSRSISRYCTARKLRYRYCRYLSGRVGERVTLPELPTDKAGLVAAIAEYRYLPGEGPPLLDEPHTFVTARGMVSVVRRSGEKWSCTFVHDRGTVSLIRRSGEMPHAFVEWVNESLGLLLGYSDRFLSIPEDQYRVCPVSDQVMLT
jgi:hypothetical protein